MRNVLIIILLLLSISVFSQRFVVEFETGLGSYSMSELSEVMRQSAQQSMLSPKVVSDFPAYLFYRPGIGIKSEKHHLESLCKMAVQDACNLTNPRPATWEEFYQICEEVW